MTLTEDRFEWVINSDKTLKYFCREAKIEWDKPIAGSQLNLRLTCLKLAFRIYLETLK